MTKQQANWVEIDPETLPETVRDAYAAYKDYYRTMKTHRQLFEQAMAVGVPAGQRMIFGYNFGKLSVALVEDDRKPPAKAKQSLSAFLAAQAEAGRRA